MKSLAAKLSLAFLGTSLIGIVLVGLISTWFIGSASRNFEEELSQRYVENRLVEFYEANSGWPQSLGQVTERGDRANRVAFLVTNLDGEVVFNNQMNSPREIPTDRLGDGIVLESGGEEIGILLFGRRGPSGGRVPEEANPGVSRSRQEFLNTTRRNLLLAGTVAGLFSLVIGSLIARSLTKPIQELQQATHVIAGGNLEEKVTVRSDDEIGELAQAFNQMSAQLKESRDQRRRMTADIAHDLRTPLSIILGHAEGLKDGVLSADSETFHIIHDEALRLNRLIEDLRTLSLADAGELNLVIRPIHPHHLLERSVTAHTPRAQLKNIQLIYTANENLPELNVDPDRMAQVLDNIISNAIRHTPEGGEVRLDTIRHNGGIQISVQDSGEGMDAETLQHVFDRFYRADRSRQRASDTGRSGLGLAISKSIIEQHEGTIDVTSSPNHGSRFTILLPL